MSGHPADNTGTSSGLTHQSYPGGLVQIEKRRGRIARVKPEHGPPVVELNLSPGQYVVSIELTEDWAYGDRKTSDWSWTAYVATQLGGGDG